MKIGIVGTGAVGCACALAAAIRGSAREIVLVNRTRRTAEAVAADIRYGTPLCPKVEIADGDYDSLIGAALVMITAGINEKTGGANDRDDPQGRLRLLDKNAAIYRDIVPRIARAAPSAVLLVVTDPPDPLADVAREAAGQMHVLSDRHVPRQPALSRPSRPIFRRRSLRRRGSSDRRPWHEAGVFVVFRAARRRAN